MHAQRGPCAGTQPGVRVCADVGACAGRLPHMSRDASAASTNVLGFEYANPGFGPLALGPCCGGSRSGFVVKSLEDGLTMQYSSGPVVRDPLSKSSSLSSSNLRLVVWGRGGGSCDSGGIEPSESDSCTMPRSRERSCDKFSVHDQRCIIKSCVITWSLFLEQHKRLCYFTSPHATILHCYAEAERLRPLPPLRDPLSASY